MEIHKLWLVNNYIGIIQYSDAERIRPSCVLASSLIGNWSFFSDNQYQSGVYCMQHVR